VQTGVWLPVAGLLATASPAQTAKPVAAPAAASSPWVGAAMQKAQRAAESPMRAILEASKVRRRIEPEPIGDADPPARRAAPPRANTAVAEAARPPARAAAAPVPAAEGPVADLATTRSELEAGIVRTLPAQMPAWTPASRDAIDAAPLAPLPRVAASAPAAAELPRVPALPEAPMAAPRPAPAAGGLPQLLRMVEPEVSPRLINQLSRPEVSVQLTILADGTVGAVQVLPPVPRQMVPPIVAAVEQWRFAPLPGPRQHRVRLVFRSE
jgi:hypothetical protein